MSNEINDQTSALQRKANYFYNEYLSVENTSLKTVHLAMSAEIIVRFILVSKNPLLNCSPAPEHLVSCLTSASGATQSRTSKEIWKICYLLYPPLSDHNGIWIEMSNYRNEFVHSGNFPSPSDMWEPRCLRLIYDLLEIAALPPDEFFSNDFERVMDIVGSYNEKAESSVKQRIAEYRKNFERLSDVGKREKIEAGVVKANAKFVYASILHVCPSCNNEGRLAGVIIEDLKPTIESDGTIHEGFVVRSNKFHCWVCDLQLFGNFEITVAQLPSRYNFFEVSSVEDLFAEEIYERGYRAGQENYADDYGSGHMND